MGYKRLGNQVGFQYPREEGNNRWQVVLRKRDRKKSMTIDHVTILLYIIASLAKYFGYTKALCFVVVVFYNLDIQESDGFLCFGFSLVQTELKSDEKEYTAGSELWRRLGGEHPSQLSGGMDAGGGDSWGYRVSVQRGCHLRLNVNIHHDSCHKNKKENNRQKYLIPKKKPALKKIM